MFDFKFLSSQQLHPFFIYFLRNLLQNSTEKILIKFQFYCYMSQKKIISNRTYTSLR